MLTLNNGIKYLGFGAVVYFLIKAFAKDKLSTNQISMLVVSILAMVIFLTYDGENNCKKKRVVQVARERFQVTNPPLVDSIYPGPDNTNQVLDDVEKDRKLPNNPDEDLNDFKDIMQIDKKTYEKLIKNEKNAEDRIKKGWKNEMVYTKTHPFNTVPLGTQLYGYTYLPPENWFRAYERPPVCVTDKRCPVGPITAGGPSNLMEFDTSNNVLGPEGINLRYVKKVLNDDRDANEV